MPLGHSGVVAVDPATGATKYFEYGRYGDDFGRVRTFDIPHLVMDPATNRPTESSLNKLKDFLRKHELKEGSKTDVNFTYHPDSNFRKVVDFATRRIYDRKRKPYAIPSNTCKTFASEAIEAGKK